MTEAKITNRNYQIIVDKLGHEPQFRIYLNALENCIQKNLKIDALIRWWDENNSRIQYDEANYELEYEFLETIDRIQLGSRPWNEEIEHQIKQHELELKKYYERHSDDPGFFRIIDQAMLVIEDNRKINQEWVIDNPSYRTTPWAMEWLPTFNEIYGENGPIEIIAKRFNGFFGRKIITETDDSRKNPREYPLGNLNIPFFDKPVYVRYGSTEHRHLIAISAWIGKKQNNMANVVFNYILATPEKRENTSEMKVVDAAKTCSHRLFSYLIKNRILKLNKWEVLVSILKLPLAVSAHPKGKPHLTSELGFGGFFFNPSDQSYKMPAGKKSELISAWKNFFNSYSKLRIEKNHGKSFRGAYSLYAATLISFWKVDYCYEHASDYKSSCVMKSLSDINADILCALEFFNDSFYPILIQLIDYDWESVAEFYEGYSEIFNGVNNIQFSLIDHLVQKEEWYDLACSMLAFYLVTASTISRGILGQMNELPRIIKLLSNLPGFQYVSRAIDYACDMAQKYGRSKTYARLHQLRQSTDKKIHSLIAGGETKVCAFKSTLRRNLHSGENDQRIEHSALKTIAGFLNREGGTILVGVGDNGDITGIDADGFESFDKWQLHLKNIIDQTLPNAMKYIESNQHQIGNKTIALITCNRSETPIYYQNRDAQQQEFYVRRGTATDNLMMAETFEYIGRHFHNAAGR